MADAEEAAFARRSNGARGVRGAATSSATSSTTASSAAPHEETSKAPAPPRRTSILRAAKAPLPPRTPRLALHARLAKNTRLTTNARVVHKKYAHLGRIVARRSGGRYIVKWDGIKALDACDAQWLSVLHATRTRREPDFTRC